MHQDSPRLATWTCHGADHRRHPQPPDLQQLRAHVDWLSWWMDSVFEVPGLGWRFGLDPIVGLIPGVGDAATALISFYIVALAARAGVPRITVARMSLNVALDMVMGSLPLVGDVLDASWKANRKNALLLRERLAESPLDARRASRWDWLFVGIMLVCLTGLFAGLVWLFAWVVGTLWHALFGG